MRKWIAAAAVLSLATPALANEPPREEVLRVQIHLSELGPAPRLIKAKVEQLVELTVTRTTDEACANFDSELVDESIPFTVGEPRKIAFRPHLPGTYTFACGSGTFVVE